MADKKNDSSQFESGETTIEGRPVDAEETDVEGDADMNNFNVGCCV
jgi:hypothetical protein